MYGVAILRLPYSPRHIAGGTLTVLCKISLIITESCKYRQYEQAGNIPGLFSESMIIRRTWLRLNGVFKDLLAIFHFNNNGIFLCIMGGI